MKNKYTQEPQDFSEDFGGDAPKNSHESSSHDSLVSFLKQHKSIAPPPAPNFEQQLFAEISKYPQPVAKPFKARLRRWLPWALAIPVAIATGVAFNWATSRTPQYQIANAPNITQGKPQGKTIGEADRAEIEQSLIYSWDATDNTATPSSSTSTDNQILSELSPLEYE